MDKFTPGPWDADVDIHWVNNPTGEQEIHGNHIVYPSADIDLNIAEVNTCIDEGIANARLIAAAPDLYYACNEALNALIACAVPAGGCDDREALLMAQQALRAAIAKAVPNA